MLRKGRLRLDPKAGVACYLQGAGGGVCLVKRGQLAAGCATAPPRSPAAQGMATGSNPALGPGPAAAGARSSAFSDVTAGSSNRRSRRGGEDRGLV